MNLIPVLAFGHHLSNRIAPLCIMAVFFVRSGRFGSFINFNENKAGWVVILLKNIKTGNASSSTLLDAFSRVACLKASDELQV
ncbi:MAG: hypothetical protein IPL71_20840 [Anaerolineales bacterium]|nr:hypothetical protein [Anaerolineales bacterium]